MKNIFFIHSILVITAGVEINGVIGTSVRLSNILTNAENIPKDCHPITDFHSIQVQGYISKVLKDQPVWLPLRWVNLDGWYWTSQEFYGHQISTKEWHAPRMDCAVLRSLDKIIDDVYCDRIYGFYICQGLGRCDSASYGCLNISGITYNVYNQSGTWYEASDRCHHRHRQSLAAFGNDNLQLALQTIAQHFQKWANIWIGLVRSTFQITTSDKQHLKIYKWDKGQPSNLENSSCVVAVPKDVGYVWRSENCNTTHPHLCKAEKTAAKTTAGPCLSDIEYFITSTPLAGSSDFTWKILFGLTGLGLFILLPVLVRLWMKLNNARHQLKDSSHEKGKGIELETLLETGQQNTGERPNQPQPSKPENMENINRVNEAENILAGGKIETGVVPAKTKELRCEEAMPVLIPQQGQGISQEMLPKFEIRVHIYYSSNHLTVDSWKTKLRTATHAMLQLLKDSHGKPSALKLKSVKGDETLYECDIRSVELHKSGDKKITVTNLTTKTEDNSRSQEKPFDIIFLDTRECTAVFAMATYSSKENDKLQQSKVALPQNSGNAKDLSTIADKSVVRFQAKVKCTKGGAHNTKDEPHDLKIVEGTEGSARVVLKSLSSAEIICDASVSGLKKPVQKHCRVTWSLNADPKKDFAVLFEDQAELFTSLIKDLQNKEDNISKGLSMDHFQTE